MRTLPPLSDTAKAHISQRAHKMVGELRTHGGGSDGSVTRLVYSPEWQAAMQQVESWFTELDLELRVDAVGSRFGRLAGPEADVVVSGSHVDSVRHGGAYDGALGVIMATLAIGWLSQEHGAPQRSLEVFANCEEESSRFPGNFWGSRALMGRIAPDEPETLTDRDGVSIGDAMASCSLDPSRIPEARRTDISAFIEPHIEQGTRLGSAGATVGVVDSVVGVRQMEFRLAGSSGHAGTIPMADRRDALIAAAELVTMVREVALEAGDGAVATVGFIQASPGGANQIAEEARLTVDFRHPSSAALDVMEERLRTCGRVASARHSIALYEDLWLSQSPVDFDPTIRDLIEQSCKEVECEWTHLHSGAGHDAQLIAQEFPTAMLFVPSEGGHSHRPDEETALEDIVAGTEVLIRALYQLGYVL